MDTEIFLLLSRLLSSQLYHRSKILARTNCKGGNCLDDKVTHRRREDNYHFFSSHNTLHMNGEVLEENIQAHRTSCNNTNTLVECFQHRRNYSWDRSKKRKRLIFWLIFWLQFRIKDHHCLLSFSLI